MPDASATTRTAIITGASAGIGLAIAKELVARGTRVIVNARRTDRLAQVTKDLNASKREPVAALVAGDCADQVVIDELFRVAESSFGAPADAVIVNAGRGLSGGVASSDVAQWEDMIRTNYVAAARLMRTAAERLLARVPADASGQAWETRPRDIVVIGSIVGRHVSPFSGMYGSTKFAVHGMAEALRREVAPRGVRVTLIEPGFVVSDFQDAAGYKPEWFQSVLERIGPVLQPEDVARAVAFVLAQPAHVHVSDIVVRPTRQDYP